MTSLWATCSVVAQGRQKRTLATNGVMTRNYRHGNIILVCSLSAQKGEFSVQVSFSIQLAESKSKNRTSLTDRHIVLSLSYDTIIR